MARPESLECIRCRQEYPLDAFDRQCGSCAADGVASNLTPRYRVAEAPRRDRPVAISGSLWRYADHLPLAAGEPVTMGEGMTPMIPVEGFGHGPIRVKDESRNPTWSFKDRLATVAVSWARGTGARMIAASSTGNAGAAAAAYAARAGLHCVVLTSSGAAPAIVSQMRAYGAMVVAVPTMEDRWRVLSEAVRELGWFPTSPFFGPAVGSNPLGVEGYKTLAYEIAEQSGWQAPDWCVLPVCYGDALYGMWKGFEEMRRWGWIEACPRLVAAEVSGSLAAAADRGMDMPPAMPRAGGSVAASIDTNRGTYQARHALKESGSVAVAIGDAALVDARDRLAAGAGLSAELSSAAALAAVDALGASGTIRPGEDVVAVLTSSGLKDFGASGVPQAGAPEAAPDLESVLRTLGDAYGCHG